MPALHQESRLLNPKYRHAAKRQGTPQIYFIMPTPRLHDGLSLAYLQELGVSNKR